MIFRIRVIKNVTVWVISLAPFICYSQQKPAINKSYTSIKHTHTLDSVFPVGDIQSITVINYNGTHTLTKKELTTLQWQLKRAKYTGGLLVKPGHITLRIKLKSSSGAGPGFVYATTGAVHFDGGTDRFKNRFTGTYYLPLLINFDNYK